MQLAEGALVVSEWLVRNTQITTNYCNILCKGKYYDNVAFGIFVWCV